MYNKIIFCLIAITAVTIVQTKTTEWWNSELSLQLDNTNFDESIRTNQYIVVNFYNKYSVESKNIAPEFEKLAENYMGPDRKRTDVVVATVDGWAYETISAAHDVHTFPEILLFSQKGLITYIYYNEYIGERMIEWVESILSVEGNENDVPLEQPLKPETYSEHMNYTSEDLGDITNDLIDPANSDIDVYYEFQDTQGKINDEIGVVLDSTLPEPRVIEVVNKATSITSDLESAINDNLHKIGELMEAIASQNSDSNGLNRYLKDVDQMLQHLEEEMHSAKAQADSSQPGPTRRYLEEVKVALDEVQTQISEHNNEEKSSWTSILFAVGLLGGAVLAYVGLKSDNKKKVRKSVYD